MAKSLSIKNGKARFLIKLLLWPASYAIESEENSDKFQKIEAIVGSIELAAIGIVILLADAKKISWWWLIVPILVYFGTFALTVLEKLNVPAGEEGE